MWKMLWNVAVSERQRKKQKKKIEEMDRGKNKRQR